MISLPTGPQLQIDKSQGHIYNSNVSLVPAFASSFIYCSYRRRNSGLGYLGLLDPEYASPARDKMSTFQLERGGDRVAGPRDVFYDVVEVELSNENGRNEFATTADDNLPANKGIGVWLKSHKSDEREIMDLPEGESDFLQSLEITRLVLYAVHHYESQADRNKRIWAQIQSHPEITELPSNKVSPNAILI